MKYLIAAASLMLAVYLISTGVCEVSASEEVSHGKKESRDSGNSLEKRIDFGDSYITGQSIKSGAVYLLQRKPSEIKSMLSYRESYRSEILENFSVKKSKSSTGASLKTGIDGREPAPPFRN